MIVYLAFLGVFAVIATFSRSFRKDLFKPEYSIWRVAVWIGAYYLFDALFGIPLSGHGVADTVGIVTLAVVLLFPLILIEVRLTNKWWRVSREPER